MNGSMIRIGTVVTVMLFTAVAPASHSPQKWAFFAKNLALQRPAAEQGDRQEPKAQIYESYKVNNDILIEVLPVRPTRASTGPAHLVPGTEITVLEADGDEKYGDVIRIGIDSDGSSIPSDFWVRANDLLKAGLEVSEISYDNVDPVLAEQDLDSSPFLLQSFRSSTDHGNARSMYRFRYIKQYLLHSGLVGFYLPGTSIDQAPRTLEDAGFARSGRLPHNARLNEICVYEGGNSGDGHIEIKLKNGWWYGYGLHGQVIMKNRRLDGCFAKPELNNRAHGSRRANSPKPATR